MPGASLFCPFLRSPFAQLQFSSDWGKIAIAHLDVFHPGWMGALDG
jgi:hypothetical protein